MAKTSRGAADGQFAYDGLDRLLHEKARLGILAALLTTADGLRFGELKRLCTLTDGNLSQHLELLRTAGIVEIWKGFENRRPQTLCRLTPEGRRRFADYLRALDRVVQDALPRAAAVPQPAELPEGWVRV